MKDILKELSAATGLRNLEVRRIMLTAPGRYKTYLIPKRNGGHRVISQPAREVKVLQRALVAVLLRSLPVHQAAMAYREGLSIRDNAERHAKNGPILKMDFREFFPSIRPADWVSYCERTKCLTAEDEILLTSRLLFHKPRGVSGLRLAIGAPSSPMLSNIIMFDFDELVTSTVARDHVTYTRYADDLTFSGPRTGHLVNVIKQVAKISRDLPSPKLNINSQKTTYITKKYHRQVTGLTLSNDGRVTVGRDNKRLVHSAVHRASLGQLAPGEMQVLSGMLAFINAVEPEFLDVLRKKYGADIIFALQKFVRPGEPVVQHRPPLAARTTAQ